MVNSGICGIANLMKLVYGNVGGYGGYDTGEDTLGDTATPVLL